MIDNDVMSKLAGGGVVVPVGMGSMITEGGDTAATSARRESKTTMVLWKEQWKEQWQCHCPLWRAICAENGALRVGTH